MTAKGGGRAGWLLVGGLVLAGCSGGGTADPTTAPVTEPAPAPTTSAAVTTTTSRYKWTPEQQAVVDAYVGFDRAFHNAYSAPTLDLTELARYSAGQLFENNKIMLMDARDVQGYRSRPGPQNLAQVVVYQVDEKDGRRYARVCVVDDEVVFRTQDGSILNDKVETRRIGAQIERVDGQYKVTGKETVQTWPGAELATCLAD
jgi:hypothetical protein